MRERTVGWLFIQLSLTVDQRGQQGESIEGLLYISYNHRDVGYQCSRDSEGHKAAQQRTGSQLG